MLACKIPSKIKVGCVYYSFLGVSFDDGSSSVEAHERHVRSSHKKMTYISPCGLKELLHKREGTFVNLVIKINNVTWIDGKWAKYISKDNQIKFELKERLPEGVYTTKLQALKYAIKKWSDDIVWYNDTISTLNSAVDIKSY